jgi:serine/threonine protein kinase
VLTASVSSWIGSRVGKYHILRELGRGGMGEVYLAEDTLLGREVALKRLLPIFAEDEEFVTRFKREARAISRLTHPGLVSVHSLDWANGVLLLDMEYVRGSSLLRTLQNSVVTPQFTARLARDVLEALTECHEHGIVHRDIKPSNILLTETLRAKLVDFGIATALADSTATQLREGRSTTIVLGTPRFMPPEAWDGGEVSPQWDLCSPGLPEGYQSSRFNLRRLLIDLF